MPRRHPSEMKLPERARRATLCRAHHQARCALFTALLSLGLTSAPARAQDAAAPMPPAVAVLPGSPRPLGPGLSPEAPSEGPAAGGRAPSFGAPVKKDAWAFSLGGSITAWESVGIGRAPELGGPNQVSTPLHVPAVSEGRQPVGGNTSGSLNMQYGNSTVSGFINATFNASGKERQGFYSAPNGPSLGQAYLAITPQPIGPLQLTMRVGGFTENFAGPGQWGWGLFGPLLATRGYGISANAQHPYGDSLVFDLRLGFQAVPGVPEDFVRGAYTGWIETGINSMVAHAHFGFVYQGQYTARFHYARAVGFDERRYIAAPRDGRMDVYILETRYMGTPFGQLGVSFGLWDLEDATHLHESVWWGLDWTKGGADITRDYFGNVGPESGFCAPEPGSMTGPVPCTGIDTETPLLNANGTGQLFAISAEYDTSLAQLLWHPRPFTGTAPDVRLALAAAAHFTLNTGDPVFDGASGFLLGAQLDYQMLSWLSTPLRFFGEDRDFQFGRYRVYSISPGIAFRTDWQSTDRIELIYTRRFYNSGADDNPARPLDPHVLALGANITF